MSLQNGQGLLAWEGGLFDPADTNSAELLWRLRWALAEIRRRGGRVTITEAGRPVGVRGDMYVRNAWETASGRSTMWFQWGRYKRGETPSAIDPTKALSKHTLGLAVDLASPTVRDVQIRNEVLALVGIIQTIPDVESWHYELLYPNVGRGYQSAADAKPFNPTSPEEDEEMTMIRINGTIYASVGEGVFNHFKWGEPFETIKNLERARDDWQDVSLADLPSLLKAKGCDANIWDIRGGQFVVLDPRTGSVAAGNMWSATNARAKDLEVKILGIPAATAPDPAPIVEAVKAALASSPDLVDEVAIANAVRDKFRTDPLS